MAGVGNRVLVYDAVDGDLQHALKGHKVGHGGGCSAGRCVSGSTPPGVPPMCACRTGHGHLHGVLANCATACTGSIGQPWPILGVADLGQPAWQAHYHYVWFTQDAVYCVAYSHNGKRFASGGADSTVIIWTSKVCSAARQPGQSAVSSMPRHSESLKTKQHGWLLHLSGLVEQGARGTARTL